MSTLDEQIQQAKEAIAYHRHQIWRNNDFGIELTSDREREEVRNWTEILHTLIDQKKAQNDPTL